MKICFIVGLYPFNKGGAEYQAKILSENLSKYHEIFFIMNLPEVEGNIINFNGTRIYNIHLSPIRDKFMFYYSIYRKINYIIKIEKPSLIYHRVLMPYTWHIAKIAKVRKIPWILHVSSDHSLVFTNSLLSNIRKLLFKDIIRLGPRIIVQTTNQKLMLSKITKIEINVLPNLINQSNLGIISKKEKLIVWIGKSAPIKQLNLYLDVAEDMQSKYPNLKFIVISRFFNDCYSMELLQRIETMKNIVNLREKDNDYINKFLKEKAYLLVNTSSSEGFSNTFLQAWSYGVPVISLNSNPSNVFNEYVVGGFCNNNLELLQQHILRFITNEEYYADVAINCINLIKDKFSIESLFPKYKLFFEESILS